MQTYQLLVFDWEGTLCDAHAHLVLSLQEAARCLGLAVREAPDILPLVGLDTLSLIEQLYPDIDSGTHVRLKQAFQYNYFAKEPQSLLYPGVKQTLAAFKDAGYKLAIATGKSRHGLDKALVQTGLKDLIDESCCAEETFCKPHPLMLLALMERLGHKPEETLMIGDTEFDLQLAHNAGVASLLMLHEGSLPLSDPENYHPIFVADSMASLKDFILEDQPPTP